MVIEADRILVYDFLKFSFNENKFHVFISNIVYLASKDYCSLKVSKLLVCFSNETFIGRNVTQF